ncbi:hypothetical protein D3C71_2010500 [compost metagenome]
MHVHALPAFGQPIPHHLSYRDTAVVDGRPDVQRPQILGVQHEALAGFAIGNGRRGFEPGEDPGAGIGLPRVGTNEVT